MQTNEFENGIRKKLRVTGLCAGNSPVTGEFPAQMASNAENVSISWRHHEIKWVDTITPRSTSHRRNRSSIFILEIKCMNRNTIQRMSVQNTLSLAAHDQSGHLGFGITGRLNFPFIMETNETL